MLPIITAAAALFYFSAIPIHIAFLLRLGADNRLSLGVSLFESRFALRRASENKTGFRPPKAPENLNLADSFRAAMSALKHLKPELLRLDGAIGTSDAALTALLCGSIASLGCALSCSFNHIRIDIRPDFSADHPRADLTGMISVRIGHIMIAALVGAIQYGSRRIKRWTSIPLNAS